jgi:hypothetical protein
MNAIAIRPYETLERAGRYYSIKDSKGVVVAVGL